jgi:putative spermidine/putrescine transport system permease protein
MRRGNSWAWIVFAVGALYFMVPLIATFIFSLRMRRDELSFDAYASVFADGRFQSTLTYSLVIGVLAIIAGVAVVVPAAYLVRLRLPWLRPLMEFISLLPLIFPPIILVFGYLRMYNTSSILPLTGSALGTDILLTCAYVTLALPYMYRSVDTGLRSIDAQTLTEAATILGAGSFRIISTIILPNIFVAVLSGAFLTFAIVIGEFTIASLLSRPAFGPYLQLKGTNSAYEPSALAIISFILTWGAMGMIGLLGRFAPKTEVRTD